MMHVERGPKRKHYNSQISTKFGNSDECLKLSTSPDAYTTFFLSFFLFLIAKCPCNSYSVINQYIL